MRKPVSILLALLLSLSLLPGVSGEDTTYHIGDIDLSGDTSAADLTSLGKSLARIESLPRKFYIAWEDSVYPLGDVTFNRSVGADDLTVLAKYLAGSYAFPAEARVYPGVPQEFADALVAQNPYATAAYELTYRIIEDYYDPSSHRLHNQAGETWSTTLWPFGSFLEAVSDTLELYPHDTELRAIYVDALTEGLSKYRVEGSLTTPAGTFDNIVYYNASADNHSDYYYDDNAWICYQFLRAYELLGDETYLTRAEELLRFFETGLDDVLGGGIYWDKSFSCKNTCADGPIAICYLWAYQLTGKETYLDTGLAVLDWTNEVLRDSDGLYIDNIATNGTENTWKADYNQGTPLYALCLAYRLTGKDEYLTMAKVTAKAARDNSFYYIEGTDYATKKGNPIYRSWCVGWLMRGFEQYAILTGDDAKAFLCMEYVLDTQTLGKADSNGYYDPYFNTGAWGGENKTEVLQPSGICSVLTVCAHYDVYVK